MKFPALRINVFVFYEDNMSYALFVFFFANLNACLIISSLFLSALDVPTNQHSTFNYSVP